MRALCGERLRKLKELEEGKQMKLRKALWKKRGKEAAKVARGRLKRKAKEAREAAKANREAAKIYSGASRLASRKRALK